MFSASSLVQGSSASASVLAVAGLAAEGETVIHGAECAAVTYPAFFDAFKAMGADFTLKEDEIQ